jgi:type III pantothenate kinase
MEKAFENGTLFLAVDIGNTHTVLGLFDQGTLLSHWRVGTDRGATADELAIILSQLCQLSGKKLNDICDLVISCVVPPLLQSWRNLSVRYVGANPIIVHGQQALGMPIRCKHPHEVGADRLVNSIAAYLRYNDALIVVDYGTATTFDCISSNGEYLGGAIAPGLMLAAEALFKGTSQLPRVALFSVPENALGQDTASAIRSGVVYGFAGLTDGIIQRLLREFPTKPRVVATGGLASVIAPHCASIEKIIPNLTLEGLAIAYERLKG